MRRPALLVGIAIVACASIDVAQTGNEVSFVNEGVINAPIQEVWKALSTSEGYRAAGPALAEVDLRIGGTIRTRYRADGALGDAETIENVILAYEPPTMIAMRIQKPPASFPFKEAWTVITLIPIDGTHTRLHGASLGFGNDDESKAMRVFFERGNQQTIESLQKHFAEK